MNLKRPTRRYIIIKMPNIKDKERILKASREKQIVTYKGVPIRLNRNTTRQKGMASNIPSNEKQRPATNSILHSEAVN